MRVITDLCVASMLLCCCVASVFQDELEAPRAVRDRFRLLRYNASAADVSEEVADFTAYGCEVLVTMSNEADGEARLTCQSHNDRAKEARLEPGRAFLFSLRPLTNGKSEFWCSLQYRSAWARFETYGGAQQRCASAGPRVLRYVVRHDGLYTVGSEGEVKIRALFKGHYGFTLWSRYENNQTDGLLGSGLVDGGMCSDLPARLNDLAAAVTACDHACVRLFEHYGCRGKEVELRAGDDCRDLDLSLGPLHNRLSSIRGC